MPGVASVTGRQTTTATTGHTMLQSGRAPGVVFWCRSWLKKSWRGSVVTSVLWGSCATLAPVAWGGAVVRLPPSTRVVHYRRLSVVGCTGEATDRHAAESPSSRRAPRIARTDADDDGGLYTKCFTSKVRLYAYVNLAGCTSFFPLIGPFAYWASVRCGVFVTGVASCACFG